MKRFIDAQALENRLRKLSRKQRETARMYESGKDMYDCYVSRAVGIDFAIDEVLRMMAE